MSDILKSSKIIRNTKLLLVVIGINPCKYFWGHYNSFKGARYACIWNLVKAFTDNDLLPKSTDNYLVNFDNGDIQFCYSKVEPSYEEEFNNFHKLTGYKIFYE